jgi:putative FmdB family regulatory protein
MPMYEYRCEECGEVFEQLRPMAYADQGVVCPACESERVERLLSTFVSASCASSGRFT